MANTDVTLSTFYKYDKLHKYEGLPGKIKVKHKDVIFGVEIEVEGVKKNQYPPTFNNPEEHSLKVKGQEYTTIPIALKYLEVELIRLFSSIGDVSISSRCSVHVHINVRDLSLGQLKNFLLLYTIFEKLLYRISGDRWNSIYCVPLYSYHYHLQSAIANLSKNKLPANKWPKYHGLNLAPIWGQQGESSKLGTVEFRHMEGSTDVERIVDWCSIIASLKRAAQTMDNEEILAHIRTMNTTSGYVWLTREVFGRWSKKFFQVETYKEDIESCITKAKYVLPKPYKDIFGGLSESWLDSVITSPIPILNDVTGVQVTNKPNWFISNSPVFTTATVNPAEEF